MVFQTVVQASSQIRIDCYCSHLYSPLNSIACEIKFRISSKVKSSILVRYFLLNEIIYIIISQINNSIFLLFLFIFRFRFSLIFLLTLFLFSFNIINCILFTIFSILFVFIFIFLKEFVEK